MGSSSPLRRGPWQEIPIMRSAPSLVARGYPARTTPHTADDNTFDRLTALAARLVKAPTVLVTLVDGDLETVAGGTGLREPLQSRRSIPLADSFCQHVVRTGEPMLLRDARHSKRVRSSPLIREMSIVAYAGFPLRDADSRVLGAFCAIDYLPRRWVGEEIAVLRDFAALASRELAIKGMARRLDEVEGARRRAEDTLSATTPFRALVEQSLVGIYVVRGGRFRYVNATFARVFGRTLEELAALPGVLEVVAPEDRERVAEQLHRRLASEGDSMRVAFRGRRADGAEVSVEAQGARMSYAGKTAIVGTVLDVTERARAQAALLESEERYRRLFHDDLTGNYVATPDGRILACNPAFARVFGFDGVEEAAASDILRQPPAPERLERLRREKRVEHQEMELHRRDGSTIRVIENLVGEFDEAGELAEVRGYVFDITERARAEEAVRRSERRFRAIFDGTYQFCGLLSPTGTVLEVNRTVLDFAGLAPEEVIGLPCWEARWWVAGHGPEERLREAVARAAAGECARYEAEVRGAGGEARIIDFCLRPIVGEHGRAELVIFEGWDITEGRRAQDALQESEERLRLVEHATNDVIWDWDVASGRLLWNEAGHRRFRYAPAEVVPTIEWHTERVHPEDRERIAGSIHSVVSGVVDFWSDEYRFLRGDGSYATVLDRAFVVRNERGEPVRMLGSMLDTTERKRAEEAQRFLARASALLDSSLEIETTLASLARLCVPGLADYCLIDLVEDDGSVARVAVAHADPTREPLLSRDVRHPPDADAAHHPVLGVVRTREPILVSDFSESALATISHDAEHRARIQKLGLCSYMIVPLVAHDRVLGAITLAAAESGRRFRPVDLVLAEDLTHRAALAIENARLYERAQRAVGTREEVLGVVTHDLRNPLNTILMTTNLLLDNSTERRSSTVHWLELIRRAADGMNRIVGDLLDVSSIDAGRFAVTPEPHEAAALVEEAREMLEPLAGARGIRLACRVEEGTPAVSADSHQLLRVISNLVGNAVKFTSEGGTITLRAAALDGGVCFSVRDTGPGIPPEQLAHVFDRYWQARPGDRRGAGLGLAIAQGIVDAHGGRIWVESEPGRGATFSFAIPAME
ncbi:MAG TPA: PAS domain S-box protein [Longimicrobium sp.]|nr:PAS domain S-box protein [Longimicrobium sp.]